MYSNTVKNIIINTEKLIKKCSPGGDIYGCAPKSAINKIRTLPFDRLLSMTTHLPKLENIEKPTVAEQIIEKAVVGSIIEFWLTTFFYIYAEDYNNNPIKDRSGKTIKLKDLNFSSASSKSKDTLFLFDDSDLNEWVEETRKLRNAIHIKDNIGLNGKKSIKEDLESLMNFSNLILDRIPEIDYLEAVS